MKYFSDEIKLKLRKYSGCDEASENKKEKHNETEPATINNNESNDLEFTKNETIHDADGVEFQLLCGHIMEAEGLTEEEPSLRQEEDVCVLWNHVPEELTLGKTASSISYKFVMAVDVEEADVRQEIVDGECVHAVFALLSFSLTFKRNFHCFLWSQNVIFSLGLIKHSVEAVMLDDLVEIFNYYYASRCCSHY